MGQGGYGQPSEGGLFFALIVGFWTLLAARQDEFGNPGGISPFLPLGGSPSLVLAMEPWD